MKIRMSVLFLAAMLCLSGCNATSKVNSVPSSEQSSVESVSESVSESVEKSEEDIVTDDVEEEGFGSYEEILEEYTERLETATPILIEEYKEEAAVNEEKVTGLFVSL